MKASSTVLNGGGEETYLCVLIWQRALPLPTKAGWYAVLADPQMPVTSTLLDQAHNAIERKLFAMKGFHHPKGATRRFCAGWPICTIWCPTSVAPSMPGSVGWKSKEEQSQHATGSSTCKSSRREAFDKR